MHRRDDVKRPVYESASDRKKERSFAQKIEKVTGSFLKKTPPFYHVDFMGLEKIRSGAKLKFFVEVKHRKIDHNKYDTYMLSLKKWINMNLIRRYGGLPVFLAIRYLDLDLCLPVTDEVFPISYMGRLDRGDESDMEPCIMVPIPRLMPMERMRDG